MKIFKKEDSYWWLLYSIIVGIIGMVILWPRPVKLSKQVISAIPAAIWERIEAGEHITITLEFNEPTGAESDDYCIERTMDGMMKIYSIVIHHIKYSEGLCLEPCPDPNGRTNIGYGHWIRPGESFANLSEEEATMMMLKDYNRVLDSVHVFFSEYLKRHQRMALACLAYRMGWSALQATPLFDDVAMGDFAPAIDRWEKYCRWQTPDGQWHESPGTKERAVFEAKLFAGDWQYICDKYPEIYADLRIKISNTKK